MSRAYLRDNLEAEKPKECSNKITTPRRKLRLLEEARIMETDKMKSSKEVYSV